MGNEILHLLCEYLYSFYILLGFLHVVLSEMGLVTI